MAQTNKFLVSVANAVTRNLETGQALSYGIANINTAFNLNMDEAEVRGGINNQLLYTYKHTRTVEINIEQATFDKTILGLNVGSLVANGSVTVVGTECVAIDTSGSGVLSHTPTSSVTVFLSNGTSLMVTAAGRTITVPSAVSQTVDAVYNYTTTADRITVGTTTPPSVVGLTLIAEERDNTGVIKNYIQIDVPRFQVSGTYELGLTANGVSTQALNGKALATTASDCTSGEYYATVTWIPATATTVAVASIAATPPSVSFSVAAGLPATRQLTLYGIRGASYALTNITTSASYARASGCATITVSPGGLITAGSTAAAGHTALISATYYDATSGSLVDNVNVTVTA